MKLILIIDDSSVQRMHMKSLIYACPDHRCSVLEAGNGREALAVVEASTPDLVFCDVHMPVMNGLEFLVRFRHSPLRAAIPVVMVTTLSDRHTMRAAMSAGAAAYLIKPYKDETLMRTLDRQLHRLDSGAQVSSVGRWTLTEAWLRSRLLAGLVKGGAQPRLAIDPALLAFDEEDLLLCLAELVDNVNTHGQPGRPWSIQGRFDAGRYVMSVCSDGPPIAPEWVGCLSDRKRTPEHLGRGIGLAVVRVCAERNGAVVNWANTTGSPNIIQLSMAGATAA